MSKGIVLHTELHRYRYARYKTGQSIEEIAQQDKVGIGTVRESIQKIETQNALYGLDALETSQSEIVIYSKERQKIAISEALLAEKKVIAEEGEFVGQVIATEPDHDIRLRAMSELTKIVAAVGARHAKGNSNIVQVNQQVSTTTGSLMTFEDRLREVKKRRDSGEPPSPNVIDIMRDEASA